jgi:redox-sensitive bicupin YhaK (pirin superfamily)
MSDARTIRELQRVIESVETSDGAGVKLKRSLGQSPYTRLDPFLMLDEFSSFDADDYIAGFPAHPHRGFETVTYLLDGHMLHEDHLGNRGDLKSGAVQWMSAGRGIIHSEMPQQEDGRMRGFQLWINLPAREKMKPAGYRDIDPAEIPVLALQGGGRARLIAGMLESDGRSVTGPIQGLATDPLYADVELPAGAAFDQPLDGARNAFIYVFEGSATVGNTARALATHSAGVLGLGDAVHIRAEAAGARFLLLAGKPLGEPVVQYGPFVMNTREEIEQALKDYQSGELTRVLS